MLYHAAKKAMVTTDEIAEAMCVSPNYLVKITRKLADAGLLKITYGRNGGSQLNRNPSEISLYDIIEVTETTMRVNRCMEEDCYCSRNAAGHCRVHKFYEEIQKHLDDKLKHVFLNELAREGC